MKYNNLNVWTEEKFIADEERRRQWGKEHWSEEMQKQCAESDKERDEKRQEYRREFPFTAIVEGSYPETDNACRWCWNNVSPRHGKCQWEHHSEYPGCPLVLVTEYITEGTYKDKDGKVEKWKEKCYKEVEVHDHVGLWADHWLGKTGYDYGHMEFYFKNESDRDAFVKAVPTIGFGERYEND
jgi:hypothetical protein